MDSLVAQIVESFKAAYGLKITDSGDLFLTERNLLEFLMGLGRQAMNKVFQGMGNGYEGAVIYKGERKYRFVGYRSTSLHGLFGMIEYKRAYYFSRQEGGGGYSPLDKILGIEKRHTPGCQYFLSSFTGREAYEKSRAEVSRDLPPRRHGADFAEEGTGHGRAVGRPLGEPAPRGDTGSVREEWVCEQRESHQGGHGGIGGCDEASPVGTGAGNC